MIWKIIIRNLLYRPLGTLLSILLLMFGIGIISMILVLHRQLENKFNNDLEDIDLVIGAKGSPLQLVLSAVYHIDAPTGNIKAGDAARIAQNPLIEQVIPLAYGDSYHTFPILGTDPSYIHKYKAIFKEGRMFKNKLEAVLGSSVAAAARLKTGDLFVGTHGRDTHGKVHEASQYKVAGVLNETNTVLDKLVVTNIETVWSIHEHEGTPHGRKAGHVKDNSVKDSHEAENQGEKEKEITALLVKFRSPMALMTIPRMINETTNMQAASPVLEINRLFDLMGIGIATMQAIALVIMVISGLSIFITLYNRLKERKYELALARSMGSSRTLIFVIVLSEGVLLSLAGFIAGIALSRVGLLLMSSYAAENYHINFKQTWLINEEWYMLAITLVIGMAGAFIPAVKAFTLNISKTLANE